MIELAHKNSYYNCIPYVQEARRKTGHIKYMYTRNFKKNVTELLAIKTTMFEMKNTLDMINSKLDIAERKVNEFVE